MLLKGNHKLESHVQYSLYSVILAYLFHQAEIIRQKLMHIEREGFIWKIKLLNLRHSLSTFIVYIFLFTYEIMGKLLLCAYISRSYSNQELYQADVKCNKLAFWEAKIDHLTA
jgi:hypothetical protein